MSRGASQIFLTPIEWALSTLGMGALDPFLNLPPCPPQAIDRCFAVMSDLTTCESPGSATSWVINPVHATAQESVPANDCARAGLVTGNTLESWLIDRHSLKGSIPQEITFYWHQGIEGSQPRLINRSLGFKGPWSSMSEIHQGMLETATACHHR